MPELRLMFQVGGLQRLARLFFGEPPGCPFTHLLVYQWQQLLCGVRVAFVNGVQNLGNFVHAAVPARPTSR